MDAKSVIQSALNGYLVDVQSDGHFYGEDKKGHILACLSHFQNGGTVSDEWLRCNTILNEALKLYKRTLKDELYGDSSCMEVYRIVNMLIRKTESV